MNLKELGKYAMLVMALDILVLVLYSHQDTWVLIIHDKEAAAFN